MLMAVLTVSSLNAIAYVWAYVLKAIQKQQDYPHNGELVPLHIYGVCRNLYEPENNSKTQKINLK